MLDARQQDSLIIAMLVDVEALHRVLGPEEEELRRGTHLVHPGTKNLSGARMHLLSLTCHGHHGSSLPDMTVKQLCRETMYMK